MLQSDMTLKFGDLTADFAMGKIGMMPFASDWVADAVSNGMDPDDLGLCLPPAGPSGEQTTAIAGTAYVITQKQIRPKKMLHGNTSASIIPKITLLPTLKTLQPKAL